MKVKSLKTISFISLIVVILIFILFSVLGTKSYFVTNINIEAVGATGGINISFDKGTITTEGEYQKIPIIVNNYKSYNGQHFINQVETNYVIKVSTVKGNLKYSIDSTDVFMETVESINYPLTTTEELSNTHYIYLKSLSNLNSRETKEVKIEVIATQVAK